MSQPITLEAFAFALLALVLVPAIAVITARAAHRKSASSGLVGSVARVVLAVPPSGVGAVLCTVAGRRVRLTARDVEGGGLARDQPVVIVEVERGLVRVEAIPEELREVFR